MSLAQGKLDEIRNRFVHRMKAAGTRLSEFADLLELQGGDDAVVEIGQLAHRLAGSAGTFGLPMIGRQAAIVEREALAVVGPKPNPCVLAQATRALSSAIAESE